MNKFILSNVKFGEPSANFDNFFLYLNELSISKKKLSILKTNHGGVISSGYLISDHGYKPVKNINVDNINKEIILNYDGMYSFCLINNQTLTFFTDAFGLERLYYFQNKEQFIISNDLLYLAQFLNKKDLFMIDHEYLLEWLIHGCMESENTPIKYVKTTTPGHYFNYSQNKLTSEKVYSFKDVLLKNKYSFTNRDENELFDEFDEIYCSYINQYLKNNPNQRIGCYLSSGLDSRTNAWALNKSGHSFTGITYDCGSEEDTLASLQYGALTGNPIINTFMSRNDDMRDYLDKAAQVFNFTQPAENCQFFPSLNLIRNTVDMIFDGTSGDIFFGGLFKGPSFRYKKQNFGPLNQLGEIEEFSYEDLLLHNLTTRQRNWIIPAMQVMYQIAEPFAVTYNKRLIKFCFSLSADHLKYREFHRLFLKKRAPGFANILSDSFGHKLSNGRIGSLVKRINKKLMKHQNKKTFFKDQLFWSIDQNKDFLNSNNLIIDKSTLEMIAEISKYNISELTALNYGHQSYFINIQVFLNQIRDFKSMGKQSVIDNQSMTILKSSFDT